MAIDHVGAVLDPALAVVPDRTALLAEVLPGPVLGSTALLGDETGSAEQAAYVGGLPERLLLLDDVPYTATVKVRPRDVVARFEDAS